MAAIDWEQASSTTTTLNRARRLRAAAPRLRLVRDDTARAERAGRPPKWPWWAAAVDVLLLTGTPGLASTLERVPSLRAVATLGGAPLLVQLMALTSLVILVVLATVSEGFRRLSSARRSLLALAGMLTVVAGAGSVVLLFLAPLLLLSTLFKLLN